MLKLVKELLIKPSRLKFLGLVFIIIGLTLFVTNNSWQGYKNTWAAVSNDDDIHSPGDDVLIQQTSLPPSGSLSAIYQLAGSGPTDQTPKPPPGSAQTIGIPSPFNANDGQYLTTSLSNIDHGWDGQIFKWQINNYQAGLGRITVRWQGYGESNNGYLVRVDIYNFVSNRWELEHSAQTSAPATTINFDLSDNFDQYINDQGIFWVRVRADNLEQQPVNTIQIMPVASNEVRLAWTDPTGQADGFFIERKISEDDWKDIKQVDGDHPYYTDYDEGYINLMEGKNVRYRITPMFGGNKGEPQESNEVSMPSRGHRPEGDKLTVIVPDQAASIQEAVNIVKPGDTVFVKSGKYYEAVVVRQPLITIIGEPGLKTVIETKFNNLCNFEYCSPLTIYTKSVDPVNIADLFLANGSGYAYQGIRYGGGLAVYRSAATLKRLFLIGNNLTVYDKMSYGSAIALLSTFGVTMDNIAAIGNLGDCAAIFSKGAEDLTSLRYVTVAFNKNKSDSCVAAGWWHDRGSTELINSIVWNNGAGLGLLEINDPDEPIKYDNSIVGPILDARQEEISHRGDIKNINPELQREDNPHLQPNSPAINMAVTDPKINYDFENRKRDQNQEDIGAAEYGASPISYFSSKDRLTDRFYVSHASLNTDSISLEVTGVTQPTAPSNFQAVNIGDDRVTVKWMDNATDPAVEQGFILYRNNAVAATIAAHTGTGEVLYTDFGRDLPTGSLSPGTQYCYQVKAYNGSLYSDPAPSTPLCVNTTGTPGVAPVAPSNVVAQGISALQMRLTWNDNSSDEEGFIIYRKRLDDSSYTIVSPPAMPNTTSYVDWGGDIGNLLPGNTYCYQIAAYNIHGVSLAVPASGACGTTLHQTIISTYESGGADTQQPSLTNLGTLREVNFSETDAPGIGLETNFNFDSSNAFNWQIFAIRLDTTPSNLSSLDLRWRGRGENLVNYPVKLMLYDFNNNSWQTQCIFEGGACEHDINSLTTYTINLTSQQLINNFVGSWGSNNNMLLFWVRARAFVQPPVAPTQLISRSDPAPTTIYLQWHDNSNNETAFELQRQSKGGEWSILTTLGANVTTYDDTAVTLASAWKYRVLAKRGGIDSDPSNELTVTTSFYEPAAVSVVPGGTESSLQLRWALNNNNGNRFPSDAYYVEIFRSLGDICSNPTQANWSKVGEAPGMQKAFEDAGLLPSQDYSYRLRFHVSESGQEYYSRYSSPVCTRTTVPGAPPAPNNLQATAHPTSFYQINLTWDDVEGENYYVLERQSGLTGLWAIAAPAITKNTTSYGDVGLQPGINYTYRLKAVNDSGSSNYSNLASDFTLSTYKWQVISSLPSRNSLVQGIAVLTAHDGNLWAASNDAIGQGVDPEEHLNIWKSTNNGLSWQYEGTVTATKITNNVAMAMISFSGKLYLLTGSNLWVSSDGGKTWSNALPGQGGGSWSSQTFHSRLTVFSDYLYLLTGTGSIYRLGKAGIWELVSGAPAGSQALAQGWGKLITYNTVVSPIRTRVNVYDSNNGTVWNEIGYFYNDESPGACSLFKGIVGLGDHIYIGAKSFSNNNQCLYVSTDDGKTWSNSDLTDIWPATTLPSVTEVNSAVVGGSRVTPSPTGFYINKINPVIEGIPFVNLDNGYQPWSFTKYNGATFGALWQTQGIQPTAIVKLSSPK